MSIAMDDTHVSTRSVSVDGPAVSPTANGIHQHQSHG